MIPAMVLEGYDRGFIAALIASSGSTALIVPPSIALIIYGALTTTSITTLFAAGVIPGFIAGLCLAVPALLVSRRKGYGSRERGEGQEAFWPLFKEAIWGLLAPGIILGGLYGGIFTPTEAAVVAVFYGLFLGLAVYRTLDFKKLYEILRDASEASAIVMLIVTLAGLFSWTASTLGTLDAIARAMMRVSSHPAVALFLVNLMLLMAGMLIDAVSIYYIFLPILLPMMAAFGWDPIWFGIVMTFNIAIG